MLDASPLSGRPESKAITGAVATAALATAALATSASVTAAIGSTVASTMLTAARDGVGGGVKSGQSLAKAEPVHTASLRPSLDPPIAPSRPVSLR